MSTVVKYTAQGQTVPRYPTGLNSTQAKARQRPANGARGKQVVTGGRGGRRGEEEEKYCPLCIEPLDTTEKDFYPCSCGYQVCLFCLDRLKNEFKNQCPGCRTPYDQEGNHQQQNIDSKRQSTDDPGPHLPPPDRQDPQKQAQDIIDCEPSNSLRQLPRPQDLSLTPGVKLAQSSRQAVAIPVNKQVAQQDAVSDWSSAVDPGQDSKLGAEGGSYDMRGMVGPTHPGEESSNRMATQGQVPPPGFSSGASASNAGSFQLLSNMGGAFASQNIYSLSGVAEQFNPAAANSIQQNVDSERIWANALAGQQKALDHGHPTGALKINTGSTATEGKSSTLPLSLQAVWGAYDGSTSIIQLQLPRPNNSLPLYARSGKIQSSVKAPPGFVGTSAMQNQVKLGVQNGQELGQNFMKGLMQGDAGTSNTWSRMAAGMNMQGMGITGGMHAQQGAQHIG